MTPSAAVMTAVPSEPTGTVEVALDRARRLLKRDCVAAERQCREILEVAPAASAYRLLGRALAGQKRHGEAAVTFDQAIRLEPGDGESWHELSVQLLLLGDEQGAEKAHGRALSVNALDPRLQAAAQALLDKKLTRAEQLLREHLAQKPNDLGALRMLAELAGRLEREDEALALLDVVLEAAPQFRQARSNRAAVHYFAGRFVEALEDIDQLLAREPGNPSAHSLKAAILIGLGRHDEAIPHYEAALSTQPDHPRLWMGYGHCLRTVGRGDEGIAAWRRAIELEPGLGEAWWSLSDLKTMVFSDDDVGVMAATLERNDISEDSRLHIHFALGKALEHAGEAERSFHHYAEANRLRRAAIDYNPGELTRRVDRSKQILTASFFAERAGRGSAARDPIFVVGMPRAGSTLIEQILASHPLVEGTQELTDIMALFQREAAAVDSHGADALSATPPARFASLGEEYLERTRVQRQTERPIFIDKMPNNWQHLGFIHLILPNAKIIDARRHPLACCFSNFKQQYSKGQDFSYNLADVGRYYADYVSMMEHIDHVLPGRVHRVHYETIVEDTEAEVRKLLDYCELEFDPDCLRFHENERAVRTASSEQVRRPIYREGLDGWRAYERWLTPLRDALGEILDDYPVKL
jgi:tetratricopeptide (TPR) repeat protein